MSTSDSSGQLATRKRKPKLPGTLDLFRLPQVPLPTGLVMGANQSQPYQRPAKHPRMDGQDINAGDRESFHEDVGRTGHFASDTDMFEVQATTQEPSQEIPRQRRPSGPSKTDLAHQAIAHIRSLGVPFSSILETILADTSYADLRSSLANDHSFVPSLLNDLYNDPRSRPAFDEWLDRPAIDYVCRKLDLELEASKPLVQQVSTDVTVKDLEEWDPSAIVESLPAPTVCEVIRRITPTAENNKKKDNRVVQNILVAQILHARSQNSCRIQVGLGLFSWSTGASKQLMEVMSRCSLSPSFTTLTKVIDNLAERCIDEARSLVRTSPHGLAYDNINMSQSDHVEQRPNAPAKVQNGTFTVIYELFQARREHMKIQPMITRLKASSPLLLPEISPTIEQHQHYYKQSVVSIAQILISHCSKLSSYSDHPSLQYRPRRQLPKSHRTKFCPLRVSTIEEASVKGQLLVLDDVYKTQLQQLATPESAQQLRDYAIPTFVDQLTLSRSRGATALRAHDVDAWERRDVIQLAMGLFHLVMNLIWALLHVYRGTIHDVGSLSFFFALLDKARLAREKPDYHTLLMSLMQILDGILLDAWQKECGYPSLDAFADSNPTPAELLNLASKIHLSYVYCDLEDPDGTIYKNDKAYWNTRRLLRDLLFVKELISAISAGDIGRVEDTFPDLCRLFRAAGSTNYSTEILHYLHNIKKVWTPEFANIMRDNMLVNVNGKWMPIDLNIEHLIGLLKASLIFAAKGIHSDWERLGNISAGLVRVMALKKQVRNTLNTSYKGSSHTTPDLEELVWRVANAVANHKLLTHVPKRNGYKQHYDVPDLLKVGQDKIVGTLRNFNLKMEARKRGAPFEPEVDELPPNEIMLEVNME